MKGQRLAIVYQITKRETETELKMNTEEEKPDKCPYCGAVVFEEDLGFITFQCGVIYNPGRNKCCNETEPCVFNQREKLIKKNAKLEAEIIRLATIILEVPGADEYKARKRTQEWWHERHWEIADKYPQLAKEAILQLNRLFNDDMVADAEAVLAERSAYDINGKLKYDVAPKGE